jgi:hypothetical protein
MKTLEFVAKYRTGTGFITARTRLAVKHVSYVQEVPPETPEYTDGMVTTVATVMGERILSIEPYEDLAPRYDELMKEEA